jgi:hypothetical protein
MPRYFQLYHAGHARDLRHAATNPETIPWARDYQGWLGAGVYFWEDQGRCRWWMAEKGYQVMLEAKVSASAIVDLLSLNRDTTHFLQLLVERYGKSTSNKRNNRNKLRFELDAELINACRNKSLLQGLRAPFYLDGPIAPDGNLYRGSHTQVVLWDCSVLTEIHLVGDGETI